MANNSITVIMNAEEFYRKYAGFDADTELSIPASPMTHENLFTLMESYAMKRQMQDQDRIECLEQAANHVLDSIDKKDETLFRRGVVGFKILLHRK